MNFFFVYLNIPKAQVVSNLLKSTVNSDCLMCGCSTVLMARKQDLDTVSIYASLYMQQAVMNNIIAVMMQLQTERRLLCMDKEIRIC